MEPVLLILMLVAGGVTALSLVLATRAAKAAPEPPEGSWAPPREIACSILHDVARRGGASTDEIPRLVREQWGDPAPVEARIHLRSWAEAYARARDERQCRELLAAAVRLAVSMHATLPLAQYDALLDLCFGLGFHADALARLRAIHRFEYVDHAKESRPRGVERRPLAVVPLRRPIPRARLLRTLVLEGDVDRPTLIATYRRLAGRYHPDRYHDAAPEDRDDAARRFIEITEAYEQLLSE